MSSEHLFAGVLGGVTSTLVLHPLHLLKVRFAVSDGQSKVKRNYKNISNAFSTIIKEEGGRGLYKGVTPNCLGAGTAWGLYFLFYNSIKKRLTDHYQQPHLSPLLNMAAGATAGAMTMTITNPIWVVKTRLCLQYANTSDNVKNTELKATKSTNQLPESKRYSGTWDALKKVYKYEGIAGLYRGYVPGLLGVSHGAIQLAAYEEMKKLYLVRNNLPNDHSLGSVQYLICAALSKILAASITYPFQVVRARLQDQHTSYSGVIDVVKKTWRNESYLGFYKGFSPYILHVTPNICIVFFIYEKLIK